jgi:hypothetical protein
MFSPLDGYFNTNLAINTAEDSGISRQGLESDIRHE